MLNSSDLMEVDYLRVSSVSKLKPFFIEEVAAELFFAQTAE